MALSDYLQDLQSLMHDQNYLFSSQQQQTRWINEARRQCAQRTGCVRRLVAGQSAFGASAQPGVMIPGAAQPGALPDNFPNNQNFGSAGQNSCQTIPGVERYPFQGFFNPYVKATYAGIDGIIDVVSCSVNWGGAVRPSLAWLAWDDLQAYARAYATLIESYPYYWSVYNDGEFGEIWMFPAPSIVGEIELDAFCIPAPLNSDDDFDAIPPGFRNSIKFGAASIAYLTSNRYAQAQAMEAMFNSRLGTGATARDGGKVSSYYWSAI